MLYNYDGLCKHIHGHSYRLQVTVSGQVIHDKNHPKNGMVMDFGELKEIVNKHVVNRFDHSLLVADYVPEKLKSDLKSVSERIIFTPYQPTSENMVNDIARIISHYLPGNVQLVCVRLFETATSFAEWCSSDNKNSCNEN